MKRWYITQKRTREATGDEREEMDLPRYASKRSPEVYIEWVEYLDAKFPCFWHLEHLFATAFRSKKEAQRGLERLRGKIEYDVVTLMMIGKREEADAISLLPDAEPRKVPKRWPKDRRKHPQRRFFKPNRWPYSKEKVSAQLDRRGDQELS